MIVREGDVVGFHLLIIEWDWRGRRRGEGRWNATLRPLKAKT